MDEAQKVQDIGSLADWLAKNKEKLEQISRSWDRPHPSPEEISEAKEKLEMPRTRKAKVLSNFANNRADNPFKGNSIVKLTQLYLDGNKQLLETLRNLERQIKVPNVMSSDMGISWSEKQKATKADNAAMVDAIYDKTHFLANAKNLSFLREAMGITEKDVNNTKLKELILLDDWPSILGSAIPLIGEYGPKLIDYLHKKFVLPSKEAAKSQLESMSKQKSEGVDKDLTGHDEGLWIGDWKNNNVMKASKVSRIPNTTQGAGVVIEEGKESTHVTGIATPYLATWLHPERFRGRAPLTSPIKSGLIPGSAQYTMVTNADGNAYFILNPANITLSTAAFPGTNFITQSATNSTFNPVTGAYTLSAVRPGPVGPISGNLRTFRIVGLSVQITPITSMTQSSGTYQFTYFQDQNNSSSAGVEVTQAALSTSQFYQTGNSLTTYRGIFIPSQTPFYSPVDTAQTWNNFFYAVITGAPASASVAKVDVSYVLEVIPVPAQAQLVACDFPLPGPASMSALVNATVVLPAVQMLTYSDSYNLASKVYNCKPNLDGFMRVIKHYSTSYTPPKMTGGLSTEMRAGQYPSQDMEEESMEFAIPPESMELE